jgi:chemotaxis-related protein WspD
MHATSIIAVGPERAAIDDCWNRIGVRGNGSCPELKQHVHCNHCPTHAAAALTLLDREAPPDYLVDCTRHMARAPEARQAVEGSVVIFRIGAEWLALSTSVFQEVAALPAIHSLPNRRNGVVQGVANVRGELLVCVSLGSVLGLAHSAENGHARQFLALRRLVVIGLDGHRLGFAIDEMHGIQRFDPSALQAVPTTVARATATYTKAILTWYEPGGRPPEGGRTPLEGRREGPGGTSGERAVGLLDEQLLFYTLERSLA